MFKQVLSAALLGLEAVPVQVEADVSDGLPTFTMVGTLGSQVREAQDRVRTALKNEGIALPPKRITINISPADIRKEGSRFDLPIALAILSSEGIIPEHALDGVMVIGELSLNGHINGVNGVLGTVMAARDKGCRAAIVPAVNRREGALVREIPVVGVGTLSEALDYLKKGFPEKAAEEGEGVLLNDYKEDFKDIHGQKSVKRAAVMAVAGFHNMLMSGPPGSGKTMVARRMVTILPELSLEESLEITKIYSVAGLLDPDHPVISRRPFRSPHHTLSPQALAGGGVIPRPGEITLAHRGILFLDEMPEFSRTSLEILRQPLEDRKITIARSAGTFVFPAGFLLLAAMNPCPCGYFPDMNRCTCSMNDVARYQARISKPLLDRIDISVDSPAVDYEALMTRGEEGQSSAELREIVSRVRERQKARFGETGIVFNSEIPSSALDDFCPRTAEAERELRRAFDRLHLSARGVHRLLRVARTAADLDGAEVIDVTHIREAVVYRPPEKMVGK